MAGSMRWLALALVVGAGVGALAALKSTAGILSVGLLVGVLMVSLPRVALAAAVGVLPLIFTVRVGGQALALSDLALLAAVVGWWCRRRTDEPLVRRSHAIHVVLAAVAGYVGIALLNGILVGRSFAVITALYRAAMICVPLLAGLTWGRDTGLVQRVFAVYAVVCGALAVVWILQFGAPAVLGVNKNPGAQMMANAAILLMTGRRQRAPQLLGVCLFIAGILATESRGALLGLAAAVLVVLIARYADAMTWLRTTLIAAAGVGVLLLAPLSVQERLFSENESGEYNAAIRGVFINDVLKQSNGHMLIGHGVGTYAPIDPALSRVVSLDPHNVFLLEIFEGGVPLLVAFVLMTLTPIVLLWKYRRDPVCLGAVAASVALLVHSSVDIYWVRGTPTFSWLIIGIALARAAAIHREKSMARVSMTVPQRIRIEEPA